MSKPINLNSFRSSSTRTLICLAQCVSDISISETDQGGARLYCEDTGLDVVLPRSSGYNANRFVSTMKKILRAWNGEENIDPSVVALAARSSSEHKRILRREVERAGGEVEEREDEVRAVSEERADLVVLPRTVLDDRRWSAQRPAHGGTAESKPPERPERKPVVTTRAYLVPRGSAGSTSYESPFVLEVLTDGQVTGYQCKSCGRYGETPRSIANHARSHSNDDKSASDAAKARVTPRWVTTINPPSAATNDEFAVADRVDPLPDVARKAKILDKIATLLEGEFKDHYANEVEALEAENEELKRDLAAVRAELDEMKGNFQALRDLLAS